MNIINWYGFISNFIQWKMDSLNPRRIWLFKTKYIFVKTNFCRNFLLKKKSKAVEERVTNKSRNNCFSVSIYKYLVLARYELTGFTFDKIVLDSKHLINRQYTANHVKINLNIVSNVNWICWCCKMLNELYNCL